MASSSFPQRQKVLSSAREIMSGLDKLLCTVCNTAEERDQMLEEVIDSRDICSDYDADYGCTEQDTPPGPLLSIYGTNVLKASQDSSDVILTNAVIYRGPRRWSIKGSLLEITVGVVSTVNNHEWWYYHESLMGHYREHQGVVEFTDSDYYHSNNTVILTLDEKGTLSAQWKARGTDWCTSTLFANITFPVTPAVKFRYMTRKSVEIAWVE
jgi:hypothetical protein